MKITRRDFVKSAAMSAAAIAAWKGSIREAYPYSNSPGLMKFNQPMRSFGVEIPVAVNNGTYLNMDDYTVVAGWYRDQLHQSLPATGTGLYGYGSSVGVNGQIMQGAVGAPVAPVHLGHAIVAAKGRPVRIAQSSALPASHIIPFDSTIMMPSLRQDRAAIHLHGGLVPWASDGGPYNYISNAANGGLLQGASVVNWLPDAAGTLTTDLYYPNNQSARLMWYHDHAIGTTRISAYAGLASGYVLTDPADPVELELGANGYSPTDLLMVVQDKVFWDPARDPGFSTYVTSALPGDLWYPYIYEKTRWKLNGPGKNLPLPSAIPEFFGDTMLVNGLVTPFKAVSADRHRIRLLNACNARFLNLKFVYDAGNGEPAGGYLAPTFAPVNVWKIGTEGGFLPRPIQLLQNGLPMAGFLPTVFNPGPILMGPAERFDLIVDFSACQGRKVILFNDAPGPFPMGSPLYDFYPGAPKNPVITTAGQSPNTRTLMRFDVGVPTTVTPRPLPSNGSMALSNPVLPTATDAVNGGLKLNMLPGGTFVYNGVPHTYIAATQELTLNENFDVQGRLQQLVGTTVPLIKGTFGRAYTDAPTEFVTYGTIQIWNIYNLTADTHPMHVHLFNAMILRRRPFKVTSFNGIPAWTGPGRGPDPGEEGWKETFRMNPGECTTIAVLVEQPLPGRVANVTPVVGSASSGTLPLSPRAGIAGDEYVWHCHILEHEEHDMMRPLVAV